MDVTLAITEAVASIRRRLEDSPFTDGQIASAADVGEGVLLYVRRGGKSPTVRTLEKIERGLNKLEATHAGQAATAAEAAA